MPPPRLSKPSDPSNSQEGHRFLELNSSSGSISGQDQDQDTFGEKDETELRLEKLVFGDDAGFYEGLRSYKATGGSQSDVKEKDDLDEQAGIETINDADVCNGFLLVVLNEAERIPSFSLLIPIHQRCLSSIYSTLGLPMTVVNPRTKILQHGSTAMTSALPCHWPLSLACAS